MRTDQQVMRALDEIRPALQADGGDVELVEVLPHSVHIRLTGACRDCPAQEQTVKHLLLRAIQDHVPQVLSVVAV